MCHALTSTGRVVKNGVLQLLWMNQLALPNVLQLLSCKCKRKSLRLDLLEVDRMTALIHFERLRSQRFFTAHIVLS